MANQQVPGPISNRVYVAGLDGKLTVPDLRAYFTKYGEMTDVYIPKNHQTGQLKHFGFITFADQSSAAECLGTTTHEINGQPVELKPCIAKEQMAPKQPSGDATLAAPGLGMVGGAAVPGMPGLQPALAQAGLAGGLAAGLGAGVPGLQASQLGLQQQLQQQMQIHQLLLSMGQPQMLAGAMPGALPGYPAQAPMMPGMMPAQMPGAQVAGATDMAGQMGVAQAMPQTASMMMPGQTGLPAMAYPQFGAAPLDPNAAATAAWPGTAPQSSPAAMQPGLAPSGQPGVAAFMPQGYSLPIGEQPAGAALPAMPGMQMTAPEALQMTAPAGDAAASAAFAPAPAASAAFAPAPAEQQGARFSPY